MKGLAGVVAAFAVVAAGSASARTWTVGAAGADFPLIAPAIAAAAPGDVIVVGPGVYRENLVVDRSVAIVGRDNPVLYGMGTGSVIHVTAPDVEIRGLTIERSGTGESNEMDAAIQISSNGNRITGNVMRRVFYGVVIGGGSDNEIADNEITGFADLPFGRRGDGIYAYRSARTRVLRNRIGGERDGIYFQYAPEGVAEGNVIESTRYALHVMFSHGIAVRGNTARDSSVGANIMDSRAIEIVDNRFERNRGISAAGLALKACDASIVKDNVFVDNGRGLQVDGANRNDFVDNRFLYNDTALVVFSSAEQNVFSGNLFDGNWTDVVVSGFGSSTAWSREERGNIWSGYSGFDFDGDQVGDTPHPLLTPFAKIEGANPLARLFLQTPAAAGLALAASVGLGPLGMQTDPHPVLMARDRDSDTAESAGRATSGLLLAALTFGLFWVVAREVSPC